MPLDANYGLDGLGSARQVSRSSEAGGVLSNGEWINFPWSVLPPCRKSGTPITPSKDAL